MVTVTPLGDTVMDLLRQVTATFKDVRMMREKQALYIRDFMQEHAVDNVLELGFFHGKSSTYFAAILEERGRGHLTTIDFEKAKARDPNIEGMLREMKLLHRVTPIYAKRSHTWELQRLISSPDRPAFDLCYFDGGHTWDVTGFGFLLVDMLLKPGGWIILDDLDWTLADKKGTPATATRYDADELVTPGVRRVWELIVPHMGYENRFEHPTFKWGVAQKPLRAV